MCFLKPGVEEVQTGLISNDALNDESSMASPPSYLVSYLLSVDTSRTVSKSSTMNGVMSE